MPTCLDLAGAPIPASVDGASVLPLLRGESVPWREYLHIECAPTHHALTDGREKYIWYTQTGRELLFDIESDPTEMHDLSRERPDRVAYWRSRLIEELTGREEGLVQNGDLVVGCPQSPTLVNEGHYQER